MTEQTASLEQLPYYHDIYYDVFVRVMLRPYIATMC